MGDFFLFGCTESPLILNEFNVLENVMLPGLKLNKYSREEVEHRAMEKLKILDIDKLALKKSFRISGGEKQRVALARALLPGPSLLFLDEPFSALDATIKRQLQVKLREINQQLGVTILHVTHDQEEAFMLGERIAVMIDGFSPLSRALKVNRRPASII